MQQGATRRRYTRFAVLTLFTTPFNNTSLSKNTRARAMVEMSLPSLLRRGSVEQRKSKRRRQSVAREAVAIAVIHAFLATHLCHMCVTFCRRFRIIVNVKPGA